MLERANKKIAGLESFSATYTAQYIISSNANKTSIFTNYISVSKKAGKSKISEGIGTSKSVAYNIEGDTTFCTKQSFENWMCAKSNALLLEKLMNATLDETWAKEGLISPKYAGNEKIMDRTCEKILVTYDTSKLDKELRLLLPKSTYKAIILRPMHVTHIEQIILLPKSTYKGNLSSLEYTTCLDKNIGLPVQMTHKSYLV